MATLSPKHLVPLAVATDGDSVDAVDPQGERVTVTLVDREVADAPGFARRFRRLARARMPLVHPNLLALRGWGKIDQGLYLVMERCDAPTLAQRLRAGTLGPASTMRVLGGVADALDAAHAVGLVARALGPEDVKVEGEHALLGDLGIGRPQHAGLSLMVGDAVYCASPEEFRDEPLVPQSNVYSLACMLTECLTGEPPYPNEQRVMVPYRHLTEEPPSLTERNRDLPADIDEVIARAMAAEAGDRYPSPGALMQAAGSALGTTAGRVRVAGPATPRQPPAGRRRRPSSRSLLALGAALGLLVAGISGYSAGTREQAPAPRLSRPPDIRPEIERLQARRLDERTRLARAKRPRAQARIAGDLAATYASTRGAIARKGARPTLLRVMSTSQTAYAELSTAARRRRRAAYRAASRSVQAAESDLDAALRGAANG